MVDLEMLWWTRWPRVPRTERTMRGAPPRGRAARGEPDARRDPARMPPGAVILATLRGTPFAERAADLAVDLALEVAAPLVVVDVVDAPAGRARIDLGAPPAVATELRRPAERAAAEGLAVMTLRVRALHPIGALADLVNASLPGIVVFGADPARLSRLRSLSPRAYRRTARRLEQQTTCLLWRADQEARAHDSSRIHHPVPH